MKKFVIQIEDDKHTRYLSDDDKQLARWIEYEIQRRVDHAWTMGPVPQVKVLVEEEK